MDLTFVSEWLSSACVGFDTAGLSAMHSAAYAVGFFLTPLARIITFVGEKGILFFALALGMACFARTRRTAVCLFGAVCCGALITNILLKDAVARLRPCEVEAFLDWWRLVGSPAESGYSFPSGHVTATAAGMCALCFSRGKRFVLPAVGVIAVMAASRCYLMAHYPTDVLAGATIGLFSAFIAWLITNAIYTVLGRTAGTRFSRFILTGDLIRLR